jgi:hypothetical protein
LTPERSLCDDPLVLSGTWRRAVILFFLIGGTHLALPHVSLGAPSPKPFTGNVCVLVPANSIPSEVARGCHRLSNKSVLPQAPTYSAVFGSTTFGPFTPKSREVYVVVERPRDAFDRREFKGVISTLAAINHLEPTVLKVGTWSREVVYKGSGGATFANLSFVVGAFDVSVVWANSTSRSERLAVARTVAGNLPV